VPRTYVGDVLVHGRVLHGKWLPCWMLQGALAQLQRNVAPLRRRERQGNDRANTGAPWGHRSSLGESDVGALGVRQAFGATCTGWSPNWAACRITFAAGCLRAVLRELYNEFGALPTSLRATVFFSDREFQHTFRMRFGMTASQMCANESHDLVEN
jgi:hypothetical protein